MREIPLIWLVPENTLLTAKEVADPEKAWWLSRVVIIRAGRKPSLFFHMDLFVGRCTNVRERRYLCQRYKENVERPVSVQIMTAGLDETTTEMRVTAPLDISGFTRPRVLLDFTEALRQLKVMVFKADILIDERSGALGV